jgi:hypothetical protein
LVQKVPKIDKNPNPLTVSQGARTKKSAKNFIGMGSTVSNFPLGRKKG